MKARRVLPPHLHPARLVSRYHGLSAVKRRLAWTVLAGLIILIPATLAVQDRIFGTGQAELYLVAPQQVEVDKTFTVELHVKTGGASINAVSSSLKFNPRKLEIVTLTTAESFCSFYTENSFDTMKGEVHLSCGSPSPGFTGDSSLILMNMRALATGSSDIQFVPGSFQILANDGKGTNRSGTPANLTINALPSI